MSKGWATLYLNFDTDKASIKSELGPVVAEVVKLLTTSPELRLSVDGHTDNAGAPAHNQSLTEARAQAVVATLSSRHCGLAAESCRIWAQ